MRLDLTASHDVMSMQVGIRDLAQTEQTHHVWSKEQAREAFEDFLATTGLPETTRRD